MRLAPQEIRTYFVTGVTAGRRRLFQASANAELLQRTLQDYRDQGRFQLHAFVIMPDHFHAIITPAPRVSLEKAMQYIKGGFSFRLKSKRDVWMRSFNQTQILSQQKFTAAVRYIELNPVRAGLVQAAVDYGYSSASCGETDPMPSHLRKEQGPSRPLKTEFPRSARLYSLRKKSQESHCFSTGRWFKKVLCVETTSSRAGCSVM
jgi:putative transposase